MSRNIYVHWLFKEEPTGEEHHLCNVPSSSKHHIEPSIVFRPIIRQQPGGRLRECSACVKIGKALGIP